MSAILSADDLNDFISPGVACIKPVETLPHQQPSNEDNPYEVTTEDKIPPTNGAPPAQISLTDCLACSGCVTSAEAVLVSLQSHQEVLTTLDSHPSLSVEDAKSVAPDAPGRVFIASLSPQARASLAALYGVSEDEAGYMIEQLLAGPIGVGSGGHQKSAFTWVVDTNAMREVNLVAGIEEVFGLGAASELHHERPKTPVLASSCPGWICYAEKTHPHVLPHLSKLKSPQALTGTYLKSVLSRQYGVPPDRVWHLAIMPCFDKKLEASREELTNTYWGSDAQDKPGVRDVDCVITARELLMLAESRGISFPSMPRHRPSYPIFPDAAAQSFLFPDAKAQISRQQAVAGPSGGYAYYIIEQLMATTPNSSIRVERGRNADVMDYILEVDGKTVVKTARYFGFRNIQNLVRKLKPAKQSRLPGARQKSLANSRDSSTLADYAYIEVMACPGGCTNGGGQVKAEDLPQAKADNGEAAKVTPAQQKEWLAKVDEAYYSAEEEDDPEAMQLDDAPARSSATHRHDSAKSVLPFLKEWSSATAISMDKLLFTTFRKVESDVGKKQGASSDIERVAGLASTVGGGW